MNKENLTKILKQVEKPGRYIGGEKNAVIKKHDGLLTRFAFAFPDLYEIGMSYMGMQILYNIINKDPELVCERVYEPGADMAKLMKENNFPLFTLESKKAVREFDVLGFTLQYEMSFTNIIHMMDLAGIPILSKDRGEEEPLIIAGGPCAYNPEPLADFIDVFLIGDGEKLLPDILRKYGYAKKKGKKKEDFFKSVMNTEGVYIPSFYRPVYNEDGTIGKYEKLQENAPEKVRRYILDDIESADFPIDNIVPIIETVHDRAVVETFRGCTRGCRFCQAGIIYRPIRERKTDTIVNLAMEQLKSTSHEELSLLSLSTSDHSDFENLAISLMNECGQKNVSLSLPSLRLDSFSFKVLEEIQKYKKSGLTFAPEAGTQRLRDVINKGITEDDIYDATRQAIELGWRNIKLYFMIGLPTETYEDLDGIANIAHEIVRLHRESGKGGRFNVTVSVSNFVPKAHTPFQWCSQNSVEEFRKKHDYLRSKLKGKSITFNYHDDEVSKIEAVIARGDRKCGALINKAYELGCRLDSWSEHFSMESWERAMDLTKIDKDFYTTRERDLNERLPWNIVDSAVSERYLKNELNKALKAVVTEDCRNGCTGCGINRYTVCHWGGVYEK